MRIYVEFHFNNEEKPAAVTGVEGDIADILLPNVGDLVSHSDSGKPFTGRVKDRLFSYDISEGIGISGSVTVTLSLDRVPIN